MTDLTPERRAVLRRKLRHRSGPSVLVHWRDLRALLDTIDERDRLAAAAERVRVLHVAHPVYLSTDECGCVDGDHEVIEADNGSGDLCGSVPTGERYCGECTGEWDAELTAWPCDTLRALDGTDE